MVFLARPRATTLGRTDKCRSYLLVFHANITKTINIQFYHYYPFSCQSSDFGLAYTLPRATPWSSYNTLTKWADIGDFDV